MNSIKHLELITKRLDSIDLTFENPELANFLHALPLPIWFKSRDSVMMFINQEYSELYGVQPEDYIGKRDDDVWGAETAELFRVNDRAVMRSGRPVYEFEKIKNKKTGREEHLKVIKFPVRNRAQDIVGVGGIVIGWV